MSPPQGLWHRSPGWRYVAVLLVTACLTGLAWWSRTPVAAEDPGSRGQVLLGIMLVALGLFFLLLAHRDRLAGSFWSLAVGTVILGITGLVQSGWLAVPGVHGVGMSVVNNALNLLPVPFLFSFVCRAVLREHVPPGLRLFSRWLFAYPLAGVAAILVGGVTTSAFIDRYVNDPLCVLLAVLVAVLAVRGAARGDRSARVLAVAILVFCVTVVAEITIGQLRLALPRFFHSAGMLQLVLAMAVIVSQRMAELQEEQERVNEELEARVGRRTRDLAIINEELDQRIREQRELLHVLCHDLANPVGAMSGAVELLEDGGPDPATLLPLLKLATANAAATIDFVRRLRNLADRPLPLSDCDLGEAVRDSLGLLEARLQGKRLDLDNTVPPGIGVRAEPTALVNSVLANVLTNAIKFTPAGRGIHLSAGAEGDRVVLVVRDEGIGMPEHIRTGLFSLGIPTSRPGTEGERGTGYGMPMVARFMEIFGGSVAVDSREEGDGAGTEVRLTFRSAGVTSPAG